VVNSYGSLAGLDYKTEPSTIEIKELDDNRTSVLWPEIHGHSIKSFGELERVVEEVFWNIPDEMRNLMNEAHDYFKLLRELELGNRTTRQEVEQAAKRTKVDQSRALWWMFDDDFPEIYGVLEAKVGARMFVSILDEIRRELYEEEYH
jgi:hypothetical protein